MDPETLDMMAMEEMMGGAPMGPDMGGMPMGGGEDELVSVMVPAWAVPAVEELVGLLEQEGAGGAMPLEDEGLMF
jgi:hypothetical protein